MTYRNRPTSPSSSSSPVVIVDGKRNTYDDDDDDKENKNVVGEEEGDTATSAVPSVRHELHWLKPEDGDDSVHSRRRPVVVAARLVVKEGRENWLRADSLSPSTTTARRILPLKTQPSYDENDDKMEEDDEDEEEDEVDAVELLSGGELILSPNIGEHYPPNDLVYVCFELVDVRRNDDVKTVLTVKDMRPPTNVEKQSIALGDRDENNNKGKNTDRPTIIEIARKNGETDSSSSSSKKNWDFLTRRKLTTLEPGDQISFFSSAPGNNSQSSSTIILEYRKTKFSVGTDCCSPTNATTTTLNCNTDMVLKKSKKMLLLSDRNDDDRNNEEEEDTVGNNSLEYTDYGNVLNSPSLNVAGTQASSVAADSATNPQQESLRASRMELLLDRSNASPGGGGGEKKNKGGTSSNGNSQESNFTKASRNSSKAVLKKTDVKRVLDFKPVVPVPEEENRPPFSQIDVPATDAEAAVEENAPTPLAGKSSEKIEKSDEGGDDNSDGSSTVISGEAAVDQSISSVDSDDDDDDATLPDYYTQISQTQTTMMTAIEKIRNTGEVAGLSTQPSDDNDEKEEDRKEEHPPTGDGKDAKDINDTKKNDIDRIRSQKSQPKSQLLLSMETEDEKDDDDGDGDDMDVDGDDEDDDDYSRDSKAEETKMVKKTDNWVKVRKRLDPEEEAKKKSEEKKKKKAEEEKRRRLELETEKEKKRLQLEAKKKAGEEAFKKAEEEERKRRLEEEEAKKKKAEEEKERKRLQIEAKKKALEEEERKRLELEAKKKAEEEEERKRLELEAKKKAQEEEERKRLELEAKKKAEEEDERKRLELEAKIKAKEEEERRRLELEAKKKAEEEEERKRFEVEAKKKVEEEEEQKRLELEAKKKAEEEEERKRLELEAKKKAKEEEERKRLELEAKKKAKEEEEQKRLELEAKKKAKEEEEAKLRAAEERKRHEVDAKKKVDEEAMIKVNEEELGRKAKINLEQEDNIISGIEGKEVKNAVTNKRKSSAVEEVDDGKDRKTGDDCNGRSDQKTPKRKLSITPRRSGRGTRGATETPNNVVSRRSRRSPRDTENPPDSDIGLTKRRRTGKNDTPGSKEHKDELDNIASGRKRRRGDLHGRTTATEEEGDTTANRHRKDITNNEGDGNASIPTSGRKRRRAEKHVSPVSKIGKLDTNDRSSLIPDVDAHYEKIFTNAIKRKMITIVTSGISPRDTATVESFCKERLSNGIRFRLGDDVDVKNTTVCVVASAGTGKSKQEEAGSRTLKVIRSALLGIPMVTMKWVEACKREKDVVIPTDYIRTLPAKIPTTGSSTISLSSDAHLGVTELAAVAAGGSSTLFKNTHVLLCGTYSKEKRDGIVKLLNGGSATVINMSRFSSKKLKSVLADKNNGDGSDRSFILLCGERSGCGNPKFLHGDVKAAFEKQTVETAKIYVVDSNWVSLSIACAKRMPPEHFKPKGSVREAYVDLWELSVNNN